MFLMGGDEQRGRERKEGHRVISSSQNDQLSLNLVVQSYGTMGRGKWPDHLIRWLGIEDEPTEIDAC